VGPDSIRLGGIVGIGSTKFGGVSRMEKGNGINDTISIGIKGCKVKATLVQFGQYIV
jgi:hypothetical protein